MFETITRLRFLESEYKHWELLSDQTFKNINLLQDLRLLKDNSSKRGKRLILPENGHFQQENTNQPKILRVRMLCKYKGTKFEGFIFQYIRKRCRI